MTRPISFQLLPLDNQRIAEVCGQFDCHLEKIAEQLSVKITRRANAFSIQGVRESSLRAEAVIRDLFQLTRDNEEQLSANDVHLALTRTSIEDGYENAMLQIRKLQIKPQNSRQNTYLRHISHNDVNFGIGPAGTGKTYLAVACAVDALVKEEVERILLVRPAVEAGEKLGFLPGDIGQKIDPYLRPLFDALYEMLGFERVGKLIARGTIELAPLAYMRGRTLNQSFVILDEAQNTTVQQMKMFLTRIGYGSKAIITGDITQVDLPRGELSGLRHAQNVLQDINGISFTRFLPEDVVRHPLIQKIVEAYEDAAKVAATNPTKQNNHGHNANPRPDVDK